jgi:hypothetical protein
MAQFDVGCYEYGAATAPLPVDVARGFIRNAVETLKGNTLLLVSILAHEIEEWKKAHR